MQCVFGSACVWQLGGGSCQTQRPHSNKFYQLKICVSKTSSSACRYNIKKIPRTRQRRASCEQCFRADGQNFGWGQNFAQKKEQKIKRYQRTDFDVYYTIIPSICNMIFIISDSEIMLDICVFMVYIFIGE